MEPRKTRLKTLDLKGIHSMEELIVSIHFLTLIMGFWLNFSAILTSFLTHTPMYNTYFYFVCSKSQPKISISKAVWDAFTLLLEEHLLKETHNHSFSIHVLLLYHI